MTSGPASMGSPILCQGAGAYWNVGSSSQQARSDFALRPHRMVQQEGNERKWRTRLREVIVCYLQVGTK